MEEELEIIVSATEYEKGGIEHLYKETLKAKDKARKDNKKNLGKDYDETRFEVSYVNAKLEKMVQILRWNPIMSSAEDRKIIADELTRLAEELRNI